jgi:antitoxin HicB
MGNRFAFPATLEILDDGETSLVRFVDMDWVITFGKDAREIREQAIDALEVGVAAYMNDGKPIPAPSRPKPGQAVFETGPIMTAKAALYEAMRDKGMSNVALAKKLGVAETEVRRLLSPRHNSKIERLDKALAVFGKHIVVQIAAE